MIIILTGKLKKTLNSLQAIIEMYSISVLRYVEPKLCCNDNFHLYHIFKGSRRVINNQIVGYHALINKNYRNEKWTSLICS